MTTETKGDIIKSYTYDDLSRRTAFNVTDGEDNILNQTYIYDVMGRLLDTSSGADTVSYTYDANSNLLSKAYNGNVYHTAMYNKANMPVVTQLYNEGVLADTTHYTYNLDGNLAMTTGSKVSSQYYYDYGNRLVHESTWGDGIDYSDDYDYDFRGNRTKRVHKDKLTDATETTDYTYNIINQLTTQTNGTDTVNYNYDTVGNMTSVAKNGTTEKSYTYDAFNRLATANVNGTTSSYTYNGDNLRQSKTVNGVTTNHIYDGANIVADQNADTTVFVRGMGLALLKNGTTTQVYGITPRGDVAKLMSANGTTTDFTYTAYGESTSENASLYNPFGYTGQYTDAETGLVYLRNRYYDPEIGIFITIDPAKDGLNWYAYCSGNPVAFVDPWGFAPTVEESAAMAKHIYDHDLSDSYYARCIKQWRLVDLIEGTEGLKMGIYIRNSDAWENPSEYCVVFAGTSDLTDAKNDIEAYVSSWSADMWETIEWSTWFDDLHSQEITFVGHSKGGGEAIAAASVTGHDAITFNAANFNFSAYGLVDKNKKGIKNYYVDGELLYETIGPARFGTTQPLLKTQKWLVDEKIDIDCWFISYEKAIRYPDPFGNHSIDSVISALEQGE